MKHHHLSAAPVKQVFAASQSSCDGLLAVHWGLHNPPLGISGMVFGIDLARICYQGACKHFAESQ
jgi:hypothetical protein